jgi:hypothetical protein
MPDFFKKARRSAFFHQPSSISLLPFDFFSKNCFFFRKILYLCTQNLIIELNHKLYEIKITLYFCPPADGSDGRMGA